MSKQRLSASDRVRSEIDALFADPDRELGQVLEQVARLSVRLVLQAALEAEVGEFLGRDRYDRGERARVGHRNGYQPVTVKTTAGPVTLQRPKVRATLEAFSSRLLGRHVTRTNALESLVISGWVRGLSDRDVEAALREALGADAAVSRSTVSRICAQIRAEFDAWRTRDLSELELDYLFVDASHFKMHDGARSEPVLVAYGITTAGNPVFVHLDGVSAESTDACVAFLESMVARGLRATPVLVVSDGAPGLCAALDQVCPHARRQRCLIHRARNVLAKVSTVDHDAVRADYWDIFDLPEAIAPGEAAVAEATRRAQQFASTWNAYPGAVACLLDGFEQLVAHLHHPRAHWHRIRHTNLIERTFGETRRRVKVIGRLPGERSALPLLWAVLDRAAAGWRGITYTPADVRTLQIIRRDLDPTSSHDHRPETAPAGDVTAAA